MPTSDAPNLRRLARQLADYGRRLRHLETVPQLSNSSLDDHGMPVYDADGNLSVTLGKQSDGTYSARPVRGPIPPAPTGLGAEGDAGLVHASWQGVFWAGAAFPRDFEAVEVLVDGNVHGAIHDPDGGSVTVPAFAGEREVSFRTLSQAGRRSDATGHVTVTVQSKASVQLDEARGRIDEAKADSAEALVRVGEAEATVEAVQGGLDTLETVTLPGAVAELEAADAAVEQALQDARDALESDIATVRTSVDGKNAITQSVDAPPTQYDGAVGDRWERMSSMGSGGSLVSNWRWNGTVWVSTIISDAVLGNVDAAKIGTGYLDANRIEAGSISADKLLIGGSRNLIPWSQVEAGRTTDPHYVPSGYADAEISLEPGIPEQGLPPHMLITRADSGPAGMQYALHLHSPSGDNDLFPAVAGQQYRVKMRLYSPDGVSVRITNQIYQDPASGGYIRNVHSATVELGPVPQDVITQFTMPANGGAFNVRLGTSGPGVVGVAAPEATEMVGATLIEDGAVTTDKLLAGAVTAEKITVTGALSANIVDAMDVNAKKLVVTEEAILNHATLIGDTVVDNINVTGKLIGTDGVFTGTVDFENVNVTGLQLVEKLEANSISADLIEGGSFVGESFTGGTFTGGLFKTSDTLPGQVEFADNAYMPSWATMGQTYPGLRVNPIDASTTSVPAGIGSYGDGVIVDGGKATTGRSSYIVSNPRASYMRTLHEGGATAGEIQTSPAASYMRTYREDGTTGGEIQTLADRSNVRTRSGNSSESGWVQVRPQDVELAYVAPNNTYFSWIKADANEAFLFTRAGGANRYLSVDADGVWVKTNKSGSWKHYNLEETAQDSGWNNFSVSSGITLVQQTAWRNKGGIIWLSGSVRADWAVGAWTTIATLPAELRPSRNIRASAPIDGRPTHLLEINTAGALRLYRPPNDAGGQWNVQISTLMWPTG